MRKAWALGTAGGLALLTLAVAGPSAGAPQPHKAAPRALSLATDRSIGSFTPALRDPRLAAARSAALATGGTEQHTPRDGGFRFTPATGPEARTRAVRVAVRVRPGVTLIERPSTVVATPPPAVATPSGTPITPSSYNLGVSVGWRRFAITGDASSTTGGVVPGSREAARVGISYRANRRLTGRVEVAAERAEGEQRVIAEDRAYALDVGGSYSIARNVDVTGGVRYRVSSDRLEPLARDARRDSQAVYVGTAFRF